MQEDMLVPRLDLIVRMPLLVCSRTILIALSPSSGAVRNFKVSFDIKKVTITFICVCNFEEYVTDSRLLMKSFRVLPNDRTKGKPQSEADLCVLILTINFNVAYDVCFVQTRTQNPVVLSLV